MRCNEVALRGDGAASRARGAGCGGVAGPAARLTPAPPADTLNPMTISADAVVETLESAKEENALSRYRRGQVVHLPANAEVWMTGDIHDHRTNFHKFITLADLGANPERHIVLHELIHGDHFDADKCEDSWKMLHAAAELKCDFPDQVHFLMANHDLAQIHGEGIMKAGLSVCEAFNAAIKRDFEAQHLGVTVAVTEFLLSLPLAIKCPSGLWFSHSLPADDQIESFDYGVFDRDQLTAGDYKRRVGPVYQLIWGRKMTPAGVAAFAQNVGATMVITGHQPQETGYAANGPQHLIIASDHSQGVFLRLDTDAQYTMDDLIGRIEKFVSIDLDPQD